MSKKKIKALKIDEFNFQPGRIISRNYKVIAKLGYGWESEVYKIRDLNTGIERAAKLFFPHRNVKNKISTTYAKKLHRLKECPMVIHYHHQETIVYKNQPVTVLISEYVEGKILSSYLETMPNKRLPVFQALHLLHALTLGIENIHLLGEYHGDLHTDNIIVQRHGLSYELKVVDFFHWGRVNQENRNDDLCNLIQVFHESLGGAKTYRKHPKEIKKICCGLKRSLILSKFKSATDLRIYLETMSWS